MNAELKSIHSPQAEEVKPDGRSKYAASVTLRDGVVTIAIRQVERKWLPMSLFGRVVLSKAVRLIGATTVEASLQNGVTGLVVYSDAGSGAGSGQHTILGIEWPVDFRQKVFDEINRQLHRPAAGFTASISGTGAIAITAIAAYLIVSAIAAPKATASAPAGIVSAPALSASEADAMTSSAFAQKAAASASPIAPAAAATQAKSVVLRSVPAGGKGIVIWSDPLCPHCRDFEQKVIAKLPASVGVTVIPVAFKHGARPLVANVLCADDPGLQAKRWNGLMGAQPSVDLGNQCATGAADADSNSAIFARAGLSETPTIMKANGTVYAGDKESAEHVMTWLAQP